MTRSVFMFGVATATASLLGCTAEVPDTTTTGEARPTFEEFEAATYHEDFEDGVYIVNGDTPIVDDKALYEFWEMLYGGDGALIVHRNGNADAKWSDTQKLNLTYCVSDAFGSRKSQVVTAMNQATAAWEAVSNIDFIHVTAQDSNCNQNNNNVLFDVRGTSGQSYVARAFFPGQSRSSRNVIIDSSAFGNLGPWTLKGILIHELGHTLGFRHEHTRPEAGTCYEDNSWRPLTPYDGKSVMHYPQCNGTNNGDLVITASDAAGAAALYGAPGDGGGGGGGGDDGGGGGGDDGGGGGGGDDGGGDGTPQTGSASGSVGYRQWVYYQPIAVTGGTPFVVSMTGSGDPDLYVRWGSQPTTTQYNCRPYLNGATETCDLDVPAGVTQAYIGIRGYRAGSYTINVSWTGP